MSSADVSRSPVVICCLFRWRSLEDHVDGFRGSTGYAQWGELLHHYYDRSRLLNTTNMSWVNPSDLAYQRDKYYPGKKLL